MSKSNYKELLFSPCPYRHGVKYLSCSIVHEECKRYSRYRIMPLSSPPPSYLPPPSTFPPTPSLSQPPSTVQYLPLPPLCTPPPSHPPLSCAFVRMGRFNHVLKINVSLIICKICSTVAYSPARSPFRLIYVYMLYR